MYIRIGIDATASFKGGRSTGSADCFHMTVAFPVLIGGVHESSLTKRGRTQNLSDPVDSPGADHLETSSGGDPSPGPRRWDSARETASQGDGEPARRWRMATPCGAVFHLQPTLVGIGG